MAKANIIVWLVMSFDLVVSKKEVYIQMKIILQRVSEASVTIENKIVSRINNGLLILLGIAEEDSLENIKWLTNKIINLRIFNDANGKMNLSVKDIGGDVIVVSQFTLLANTKKGTRPSYIKAAKPEIAIPLYKQFISQFETDFGKKIGTGVFGADMKVALINDGPVTIVLEK